MNKPQKKGKKPISANKIYKIMLSITFFVSGVFLLKNIVGKSFQGAIAVGICLFIFAILIGGMKFLKVDAEKKQFTASISLMVLVFVISLNSGACYSDDFLLYLAVISLSGMYLRPKYALIQMGLGDILLALQYVIHPEKAESLSQYIMCTFIFTLVGSLFYMVISRGSAFIEISEVRAEEAESLLTSLDQIGNELQRSFETSSGRIEGLHQVNEQLESSAEELKEGSDGIEKGAREIEIVCDDVQDRMQVTEKQVDALNSGVKSFEDILMVNRENIQVMNRHMQSVQGTMQQTDEVFRILEQHMNQITKVTEQLSSISASTNMLALNASIEAARAGESGAGFAVVATKVQDLAVDSNKCSNQVVEVVNLMQRQIQKTTRQLVDSTQVISDSLNVLNGLQNGFHELTEQFSSLYQNIEAQNKNVTEVDFIFGELKTKISTMNHYSEENQRAVTAINEALDIYRSSMNEVIEDTNHLHKLSASMINTFQ